MTLLNHRTVFFSITLLLLGIFSWRLYDRYFSSDAEIIFFDVGQGESILLKLPFGKVFLLDAGSSSYPKKVGPELVRELSRKGILQLDGLLISHPDQDHVGGVSDLFRQITIKALFYPAALEASLSRVPQMLLQIKAEAQSRKAQVMAVSENQQHEERAFRITHLNSIPPKRKTTNNLSLVSLLEVYGCRFLLTGDIEKEAENELVKKVSKPMHVLKVAHHGSITSSKRDFLKTLLPNFAVISVGADNRYGHPRTEVLHRLRFFRTKVFRTDFHGFVSFRVAPDGQMICKNANGDCGRFQCRV